MGLVVGFSCGSLVSLASLVVGVLLLEEEPFFRAEMRVYPTIETAVMHASVSADDETADFLLIFILTCADGVSWCQMI